VAAVCLWLFVITLGTAFGAGIYESSVVLPQWLTRSGDGDCHWDAEAARRANAGRTFWAYVTTGPLTLLTLISVAAAWHTPGTVKVWWLAATAAAFLERAVTFAYFLPKMLALMRAESPVHSGITAQATAWVRLNHLRHGLTLAAWLASLIALSHLGPHPG